eukprot:GHVU01135738.1.p1 GENE.GHVU01135738.1~~GHVU01135738.1.p1  ORF type:complete len:196 (+),score=29.87 GHVU01135738.1:186-773(+)
MSGLQNYDISAFGTSELLLFVEAMESPANGTSVSASSHGASSLISAVPTSVTNVSAVPASMGPAAGGIAAGVDAINLRKKKAPSKKTVEVDVSTISWDDITVCRVQDGKPVATICGLAPESLLANTVREVCVKLQVTCGRNPTKETMISNLAAMVDVRSKHKEMREAAVSGEGGPSDGEDEGEVVFKVPVVGYAR